MSGRLQHLVRERLALLPFAVTPEQLLTRDVPGGLTEPGRRSANRSCRLLRARDGWVAINLARPDDRELLPAMAGGEGDDWRALERAAARGAAADFVALGTELQLPVARLREAKPTDLASGARFREARVLDLSALWAGPLCAGLLARAGASVTRVASLSRPDPTAAASPRLDRWLNGGKTVLPLDLRTTADRARLRRAVLEADVLVTSARPGALAALGLTPKLFQDHPSLIWIAITAHGWNVDRVGFGDDCAVAGGLIRRSGDEPRFVGDAVADPLTGLEAALAALERLADRRGGLVDVPLAGVAAAYAERAAE